MNESNKKSPLDMFFNLGNKVTGGNPEKKADFDYYMLWVIFCAFLTILLDNLWIFINTFQFSKLGWAFVMFGILWFQYYGLKMAYEARKLRKEFLDKGYGSEDDEKIESPQEMMASFK